MTGQETPLPSVPELCELVLKCLEDVLTERQGHPGPALGPTTRLVGAESVLDSLGLVTLIVDVEDRLRSDHGVLVTLADDRAMSRTRSPFRTVQSLAEYTSSILDDGG